MLTSESMTCLMVTILATFISCLLLYTYRWNLLNPNKKGVVIIDTLQRSFIYHVPKKLQANPALVIIYHGSKMKAFLMQVFTGHEFDELADANENTIVVYPQGYKGNWNDCRKAAPYAAKQLNVNDVAFTGQLISFFKEAYQINPANVFAVGFSNGGQLVMKLARQQPGWFKGFAVIGANLPVATNDDCMDTKQPVSLLLINGTGDPVNPYDGGDVVLDGQNFGPVTSTAASLQHWLSVSKCGSIEKSTSQFPHNKIGVGATAIQKTYHSTIGSKQISFVKIIGGGHRFPNRHFRIPVKKMGHLNKDVDCPKLVWDFLMALQ